MKNIEIERASVEDAQKIIDFLNKVGGETDFLSFGKNEFNFTLEEEENYIKKYENQKFGIMLSAKDVEKDIIVGSLTCQTNIEKPRLSHVYELGISILKDYWHRGIGSKFFQKAIEHIKNIGGKKIVLKVRCDNEKAISLYKKFGFEIIGISKKHIKINNEYFDSFIMELLLD